MKRILKMLSLSLIVMSSLYAGPMVMMINGERWESVPSGYGTSNINEAGQINNLVSNMTSQLTQNKNFKNISDNRIAITSFVALNNFDKTTIVSNIISENLIHELQVRGYKVIDYKTMDTIKINKDGDFVFSRDTNKLRKQYDINLVLSGTCTSYKRGLVINARILDMRDHSVVSTAQIWVPKRLTNKITGVRSQNTINIYQREVPSVKRHTIKLESN